MPPLLSPETEPEVPAAPGTAAPESAALGVALSGGGVRAALFSLGVVIGLIEAQCYRRVRCIASVSGGSILNAALAHSGQPGGYSTIEEFQPLASSLAWRLSLLGAFAFDWRTAVTGLKYLFLVIVRAALPLLLALAYIADSLREDWKFQLANFDYSSLPWQLITGFALIFLLLSFVLSRGLFQQTKFSSLLGAVDKSIGRELYVKEWGQTSDKKPTGVMHVLVATDLLSGEPMYFSGGFVYCRPYGWIHRKRSKPRRRFTVRRLSRRYFPRSGSS